MSSIIDGLTVGRNVHYVRAGGSDHLAAIVAHVYDKEAGLVSLAVFDVTGDAFSRPFVRYSETAEPGTWHWIERA